MPLSGVGEYVSFPCFSVFKSTLQLCFWMLLGVWSLACSLWVTAVPGVAKIARWEESLQSIGHLPAFVHSIWDRNIQGGLKPEHSDHKTQILKRGKLNYQINSGCIYGSKDNMKPWWKSCNPRCWALIGFSKSWDKTKSLTHRMGCLQAMLMTRSKGKVTESLLTRQETCCCGGHLLAPAQKLWEGTL